MAKKPKVYRMWGLFNYDRPPIFIARTRNDCVEHGIKWLRGERELMRCRRKGSITIRKVTVRRA